MKRAGLIEDCGVSGRRLSARGLRHPSAIFSIRNLVGIGQLTPDPARPLGQGIPMRWRRQIGECRLCEPQSFFAQSERYRSEMGHAHPTSKVLLPRLRKERHWHLENTGNLLESTRPPFCSRRFRWHPGALPFQEHFTMERVWGASIPCRGKDKMRTYLAIAAAAAMFTGTAMAQPANRDANTPAVNTPNTPPNPGAPVAGSNSFTEGQAKSRIESNGFSSVSELRKDEQGVWRGKAVKDGKTVTVSLDFQGNVTAR